MGKMKKTSSILALLLMKEFRNNNLLSLNLLNLQTPKLKI